MPSNRKNPASVRAMAGAILHHEDGHVNPLKLLCTLAGEVRRMGGTVRTGCEVSGDHPARQFSG
jgi:glycine/D-amino acid oxidase-like deaminating enzyme